MLVNNAGGSTVTPMEELTDEDWQSQLDQHVMAPMRLMRAAAPVMAEAGWGRIVNVTSSSGKRPSSMNPAYGVAKSAELALSRSFAEHWAPRGVLVNAVAPGPAATELWTGDDGMGAQVAARQGGSIDDAIANLGAQLPLGRVAQAGEIADVIAFLCSERVSTVVGGRLVGGRRRRAHHPVAVARRAPLATRRLHALGREHHGGAARQRGRDPAADRLPAIRTGEAVGALRGPLDRLAAAQPLEAERGAP